MCEEGKKDFYFIADAPFWSFCCNMRIFWLAEKIGKSTGRHFGIKLHIIVEHPVAVFISATVLGATMITYRAYREQAMAIKKKMVESVLKNSGHFGM